MRCCAKHDRIYSMILNGASLPENYCIGYAHVDKHISTRCLEVIETVANQRIFVWSPPLKTSTETAALARPRILLFNTTLSWAKPLIPIPALSGPKAVS